MDAKSRTTAIAFARWQTALSRRPRTGALTESICTDWSPELPLGNFLGGPFSNSNCLAHMGWGNEIHDPGRRWPGLCPGMVPCEENTEAARARPALTSGPTHKCEDFIGHGKDILIHQPDLPLFLASNEDDEIWVAPTPAWAEGQMEPPEVSTEYYVVFDAAGRRGHISVDRWTVVIDGWDEEGDLDSLCARLSEHLGNRSLTIEPGLEDAAYVQRAAQIISAENSKRSWPRWPKWLKKVMHGSQTWPPPDSGGSAGP
jgi:hypothetical protein